MEDKKNEQPRGENGGTRISVRPGNFMPRDNAQTNADNAPRNGGKHKNRNRRRRGGNRPQPNGEQPNGAQPQNERPQQNGEQAANRNENRDGRGQNRRRRGVHPDRGQEREPHRKHPVRDPQRRRAPALEIRPAVSGVPGQTGREVIRPSFRNSPGRTPGPRPWTTDPAQKTTARSC